jgi:hypothetical protein
MLLMLTDYAPVKEERSRKVFGLRVALPDSSSWIDLECILINLVGWRCWRR